MNLLEKAQTKASQKKDHSKAILEYFLTQGFTKIDNDDGDIELKTEQLSIKLEYISIDNIKHLCLSYEHEDCDLTDDDRWMIIEKKSIQEITEICENIIDGDFSDFEFGNNCGSGDCDI